MQLKIPKVSGLTWATFTIMAVAVASIFIFTKDLFFLLISIPMLILVILLPMLMSTMSRGTYEGLAEELSSKAKRKNIGELQPKDAGQTVTVKGTVEAVRMQFMGRPNLVISYGDTAMSVYMFAPKHLDIKEGDEVEVMGMVMKKFWAGGAVAISAYSIEKLE